MSNISEGLGVCAQPTVSCQMSCASWHVQKYMARKGYILDKILVLD